MKPTQFLACLVAVVLPGPLWAAGTDAVNVRMVNCPLPVAAVSLPLITGTPVLINRLVPPIPVLTYEAKNLIRTQAVAEIQVKLREQNLFLIAVGDAYYKLEMEPVTNAVVNPLHATIEVRDNALTVDGQPVQLENFGEALKKYDPKTAEVWIYYPEPLASVMAPRRRKEQIDYTAVLGWFTGTNRGVGSWGKIYRMYLPRQGTKK